MKIGKMIHFSKIYATVRRKFLFFAFSLGFRPLKVKFLLFFRLCPSPPSSCAYRNALIKSEPYTIESWKFANPQKANRS